MIKKHAFIITSLIFVLAANIYFRSFTINFPQLKAKARELVEESVHKVATREVYKKFPFFYPPARDRILKNRMAEYMRLNKKAIQSQVEDLYRRFKDRYQDDKGQTYLMELDCWHWARYVENVLRYGHPGDEVIYGEQWDLYMLAPLGFYIHWDQFLFYLSAFFYKAFSIFKTVPLFTFVFYLPLFFTAIFIITLFLFAYRHSGYLGGIISCLTVGLAPIFLQRSYAGWFDKDILNLLFPLLICWTYILASISPNFKRRLLWVLFSTFWVGIFCFTWTHWWFIFFVIVIYEVIFLVYLAFLRFYSKRKNLNLVKQHIFSLLVFIAGSFVWVLILAGPKPLIALYNQIRLALILNKPLMSSIWPNVYATVGELRQAGLSEVMKSIGGRWIFLPSFICVLALFIRAIFMRAFDDFRRTSILILAIWFFAMLFASFRGVRFVMFIIIPLGVPLGWMINDIYRYFKNKKKIPALIAASIILIIFSSITINRAYKVASGLFPLMNDNWYKVLSVTKEKTPEQTIVNSWWDFGDWFKVAARRRVIFDGQSQDTPQAYWMAKALLSADENKAIGILRMLNNGGNKAFEIIDNHLNDQLQSVLLLESVLGLSPDRAQQKLLEFLPITVVEEVMRLLYSTPSRACFIVEDSMIPKMSAISYLGNWDFSKVYIAQNFDIKEKDQIIEHLNKLGRDNNEIQRFYQEAFLISNKNLDDWLSHKLFFYGGLTGGREKDDVVYFHNGLTFNTKENTIHSNTGQIPVSVFMVVENTLVENIYTNPNSIFSVLIVKTEEGFKNIFLDRELANTLFTRLYFFNGQGLRHFIPFIDAQEGSDYIRVFNIAW